MKNCSYKDSNVNLKSWKHQDIKSRDTTMFFKVFWILKTKPRFLIIKYSLLTKLTQMQQRCNSSDTSAARVRHEQHECYTSATWVLHKRHEYDTSATRTTRVRHEWKILILITTLVETYFHTLIFKTRRATISF